MAAAQEEVVVVVVGGKNPVRMWFVMLGHWGWRLRSVLVGMLVVWAGGVVWMTGLGVLVGLQGMWYWLAQLGFHRSDWMP